MTMRTNTKSLTARSSTATIEEDIKVEVETEMKTGVIGTEITETVLIDIEIEMAEEKVETVGIKTGTDLNVIEEMIGAELMKEALIEGITETTEIIETDVIAQEIDTQTVEVTTVAQEEKIEIEEGHVRGPEKVGTRFRREVEQEGLHLKTEIEIGMTLLARGL